MLDPLHSVSIKRGDEVVEMPKPDPSIFDDHTELELVQCDHADFAFVGQSTT